jgi:ATP-dependent Lhr-like helicase
MTGGRERLARQDVDFDPDAVAVDDGDVLDLLEPVVQEWWVEQFGAFVPDNGGFFTPPQKEAIPLIHERENALICAPTGSGKTLASFCGIINELFRRDRADGLDNSVYCLYVSPLKSLANDIHRNLEVPLEGITDKLDERGETVEIRHAIRHGDTDDSERQRMLERTPHILNTTPETLAILLNSPKFKKKLETVEYVIVDEIHSLAENKRGTHLAVSLERLEAMAENSPTRIGCSATVEPLETMAEFLVGRERVDGENVDGEGVDGEGETADSVAPWDDFRPREYELVDTRFVRDFDIELTCPTDDLINTPGNTVNDRFYSQLHELIQDHTNTLVFTNTRSGAERVLHNLRERYDAYDEDNAGCHHGSLSKGKRQSVEEGLKAGDLDVVTTSTSLELGIDMPHIDLVVQVGSPKSVAALLQRVGRAGHQLGETVTGRVIALDRDELVECAVMLGKAAEGFVDRVFVPENAQDVAAQQVYGMAINGPRPEREIRRILRRAYPYRNYGEEDFEQLCRYLTADYGGLEEKNVYAKIWRDTNHAPDGEHHYEDFAVGEPLIGKRGRLARVIYMTNIGTIPDSFTCDVLTRNGDEWVGQLDESFLDTLESGDVFVLGGDRFEFRYRRGSKVYVDRTSARPTVPSWFSERLPLSYDLGREILAFQRELLDRLKSGGTAEVRVWLREFPLDENSVQAITRMFDEQVRYAGLESVSTDQRLVIEEELDRDEYERHYYVHSNYGRRFNDGLSRLLAYRCAREANANVTVAVADHGFTLSLPLNRKVDIQGIVDDIDPEDVRGDLRASLDGTDLLERYFRINATRALMILKRYKGHEKSASQQQVNSDMLLGFARDLEDFAVIEETYREILEDKLNVAGIEDVLGNVQDGPVEIATTRVDSPTPRAFGLATLMASDVVLAEDESAVLEDFHRRVLEEIDGEDGRTTDEATAVE